MAQNFGDRHHGETQILGDVLQSNGHTLSLVIKVNVCNGLSWCAHQCGPAGAIAEMSALSDRLVQGRLCLSCRLTGDHPVRRLRESYPEALAELCVSLLTHTAPIRERSFRFGILNCD